MKRLDPNGAPVKLAIQIDGQAWKALKELSAADRRKVSDYIRLVLAEHIVAKEAPSEKG
jgi:hypothetical protein